MPCPCLRAYRLMTSSCMYVCIPLPHSSTFWLLFMKLRLIIPLDVTPSPGCATSARWRQGIGKLWPTKQPIQLAATFRYFITIKRSIIFTSSYMYRLHKRTYCDCEKNWSWDFEGLTRSETPRIRESDFWNSNCRYVWIFQLQKYQKHEMEIFLKTAVMIFIKLQ
jgi:hypothetical protein